MAANKRAEIFAETANRKGLAEAIIEKDFWVCWTLKQLFSIEALSGRLLFKGGTSLSKIFHAISRFSDYAALGFIGDRDPRQEGISRNRWTGIALRRAYDQILTALDAIRRIVGYASADNCGTSHRPERLCLRHGSSLRSQLLMSHYANMQA